MDEMNGFREAKSRKPRRLNEKKRRRRKKPLRN
jgi:hypothetical protein